MQGACQSCTAVDMATTGSAPHLHALLGSELGGGGAAGVAGQRAHPKAAPAQQRRHRAAALPARGAAHGHQLCVVADDELRAHGRERERSSR
jgi:hypothetical protein